MERSKYIRMKLSNLPADFVKLYNLQANVTKDGYVYIKISRGMYGLLHAGILAQDLLEKCLNAKVYRQSTLTHGLCKHAWQSIPLTLCVDDFGVNCFGKEHVNHLLKTLHENYTISTDW